MNRPRSDGLTRDLAERLLRGDPGVPQTGTGGRLIDLFAAAAATTPQADRGGEEVAVSAFREAHLAATPRPRRPLWTPSSLARLAIVKIAVIAALVAGGLAVANKDSPPPTGSADRSDHADAGATNGALPSIEAQPGDSQQERLEVLCTEFLTSLGTVDTEEYAVLEAAAGGSDEIQPYCAALVPETGVSPSPSGSPDPSGSTSASPGDGKGNPGKGKGQGPSKTKDKGPDKTKTPKPDKTKEKDK